MHPISKYKFYITKDWKVIAVSTYAGKTVKGVAKLNPADPFDMEKGKKLAAARCEEKVCKKRLARSEKKLAMAKEEYEKASRYYDNMAFYNLDAMAKYNQAIHHVNEVLNELKEED